MLDRPMSWPLTRYCDRKDINPTILHNKRRGRINNRPVVIDRYELHTRLTNVLDQMIPPSLMVVDINSTPHTGSVYQGNYKVEYDGYSALCATALATKSGCRWCHGDRLKVPLLRIPRPKPFTETKDRRTKTEAS